MRTCAVIYNPNSGHTLQKKNMSKYRSIIESYGYTVTIIGTEYKGHAKEIVSHIGYVDLVMSMGGDGTFNEVVNGNLSRKNRLVLAHIPVGTTNDVGVMFGYGKNIEENINMCLTGVIKGIDIPLINGRPFVYVAGFGKFLNIPYDTPRSLKKKYGHLAYLISGVKDFLQVTKNYDLTYEVNGKVVHGLYSFMLISSANRIAGVNNFYKDVKLDDDTFEVLMCTYTRRIDIVRAMAMLIATDAEHVDGFESFRASKIKINFKNYPKKAWCIDGEKLEIRTKTYTIENEKNVAILMPKKNIKKLFINN
jgi:diacylglycerol kinase (ATP)